MFDSDGPVYRYVTPFTLGVPVNLIAQRYRPVSLRTRLTAPATKKPLNTKTPQGQLLAFYAAGPDEPAAEEMLPNPGTPDKRFRYGVFTYALHQQLETWTGDFRDLASGVVSFYKGRPYPTPQFDGNLQTRARFPAQVAQPDKSRHTASSSAH
jgi:hypothetical protein